MTILSKMTLSNKTKATMHTSPEIKLRGKMLGALDLQIEAAKAYLNGGTFIRRAMRWMDDPETGSIRVLEAVLPKTVAAELVPEEAALPEAVAAEAVTPETLPEKVSFGEAVAAEAVTPEAMTPEAVTALGKAVAESALTSVPDFRETLGRGQLGVAANRCRRQELQVAEQDRLRRCRLQDSEDAQEEAQGQAHRAEHPADRYGDLRSAGFPLCHCRFLPSLSASCHLTATA